MGGGVGLGPLPPSSGGGTSTSPPSTPAPKRQCSYQKQPPPGGGVVGGGGYAGPAPPLEIFAGDGVVCEVPVTVIVETVADLNRAGVGLGAAVVTVPLERRIAVEVPVQARTGRGRQSTVVLRLRPGQRGYRRHQDGD